jgi:hypothetical protein
VTDPRLRDQNEVAALRDAIIRHAPSTLNPREYLLPASYVPAVYRHAVRDLGQQLTDDGVTALHLLTRSVASLAAYALSVRLAIPLIAHWTPPEFLAGARHSISSAVSRRCQRQLYSRCRRTLFALKSRASS